MPNLRMHVSRRQGDLWWKEMNSCELDVEQIVTNDDPVHVLENLLKWEFDSYKGPLWFVRSLNSRGKDIRDSNFNITNQHVCFFGFHHSISDGTTNMHFCNVFLELLNDLMEKNPVDVKEDGNFTNPFHNDFPTSQWFLAGEFGSRIFRTFFAYGRRVQNFLRYYPSCPSEKSCTLLLQSELDEKWTDRLLKRCKMEGVTLNTAYTAAANISMFNMMLDRDDSIEKALFCTQQAINMRRYWPFAERKNSYGAHIFMLDINIPTRKSNVFNFWEYTRKIHSLIYNELNVEKRALKLQRLSELLIIPVLLNSWMSEMGLRTSNDSHYCITNMGNVSGTFSGKGAVVNVSKLVRSVSCHYMQSLCQHTLQTFKGQFHFSLDYYPNKMSVNTARTYIENITKMLKRVIHSPN